MSPVRVRFPAPNDHQPKGREPSRPFLFPPARSGNGGYTEGRLKRVLLYGVAGGALIALLKLIEYQHFIRFYPTEIYGGLIALIFTAVGIYAGLRLRRPKEVVVVKEVQVRVGGPFVLNADKLKELAITQREHEILGLIAEGLSNREIAERLFVSENTVKTHSSRIFDKLGVSRRTQAVQRAKEFGLIP
jgi:DNA-binding CsgD family transcriptional regulator